MIESACTSLANHIAERRDNGLVDIKFYIHSDGIPTPEKVCAEAAMIFDAIKAGAVEPLILADKGLAAALA